MSRLTVTLCAVTALASCSPRGDGRGGDTLSVAAIDSAGRSASVTLRNRNGLDLGVLAVSDHGGTIALSGTLHSLPPGAHGIHLHMAAQCEPPFESAGGHWNPGGRQHGLENPQGPHQGDLPSIDVGADSTATVNVASPEGRLAELLDLDGAAVVIHALGDDQRTDPSGGSGDRIACGVVEAR